MELPGERAAVAGACRQLLATGLVRGTSGNVSVRCGEAVAVSPTGVDYHQLRDADVAVVGTDGAHLAGELAATSELALHLAVYRRRPEVTAVVHTHSMFATTFAVLGEPLPAVHYLIARAGETVPVAPYARYGTVELAESCVRTLEAGRAVLLANHGVVAVGTDLAQAMAVAEAVEFVAELAWRARLLGTPVVLSSDEVRDAGQALAGYGRTASN